MITIGERINGMFRAVKNAIKDKNASVIQEIAKSKLRPEQPI